MIGDERNTKAQSESFVWGSKVKDGKQSPISYMDEFPTNPQDCRGLLTVFLCNLLRKQTHGTRTFLKKCKTPPIMGTLYILESWNVEQTSPATIGSHRVVSKAPVTGKSFHGVSCSPAMRTNHTLTSSRYHWQLYTHHFGPSGASMRRRCIRIVVRWLVYEESDAQVIACRQVKLLKSTGGWVGSRCVCRVWGGSSWWGSPGR